SNTISGYRKGITAQNVTDLEVYWNEITDIKSPVITYFADRSYGIGSAGCAKLKVFGNTISNSTTDNWRIEGISFNNSPSSYITWNTIEHMGKSIFAGGASAPSIIQKNIFNAGVDGFFLNWGIVGTQGQVLHPQDNQWQGTFTDHQMVSYNSNGNLSDFWTKQGSSYMPTDNYADCSGTPPTCLKIKIDTTTGNSLARCYTPIPLPWTFNPVFIYKIIQDSLEFPEYNTESKWMAKQGLYKYLILNDTIITDTLIQQFKAAADTGNLGRFERVNQALLQEDYSVAEAINDSINASVTPEIAAKRVNGILINSYINDKENYSFSESDIDTLVSIAQQCAYYYGNAVYHARMLLSLIDTSVYNNDCEFPEMLQARKMISYPATNDTEVDKFSVYPNPANDYINVINESDNIADITLYNYLGKSVKTDKLRIGINIISTKELINGIYVYKIMSTGNTNKSGKLIILR
ncbi:MAG: T9SS type A sorting domain-containing protein, partial [Bacteroidetes bacterium]|nr:T9SS type A sorting domain-containing protein [Bacteroidota bacterium]